MADVHKGWVTLLRCIQDHEIWRKTPFGKGQAWVDLILSANHKNNKFMIGNTIHEVKRGELITSQRKLAERWGWSRNTARSFLDLLQTQRMIEQKTTHKLSHITIINYNSLQTMSPTNRTMAEPFIEPWQSHSLNTNNNVSNVNNENNVNKSTVKITFKNRFLEFVLLTEKEHQGLREVYGDEVVKEYIERLNNYIGAKGVQYKSHYHAIQTWIKKDRPQTEKRKIGNPL